MIDTLHTEPDLGKRKRGIRNTVVLLLVLVAVAMGLIVYKVTKPRILTPVELRNYDAIVFEKPRQFSDITLTDHNGNDFTRAQLQGKWSLIFFGFTHCPDICPMTLLELHRLLPDLPEDVRKNTQVILVTLDPARDTPQVLKEYVAAFNPNFIGVTGEFLTIRRFANEVNVAFAKVTQGEDYTVDHSGNLVLINPRGDYHGFFKPPFDTEKLQITYPSIYRSFEF